MAVLLLGLAYLLQLMAAEAEPLATMPAGCVAVVNLQKLQTVAYFQTSKSNCQVLDEGSPPAVYWTDSAGTACYFPYAFTLSQLQNFLQQNGYGSYDQCTQAVTAQVVQATQAAASAGLINTAGTGTTSSTASTAASTAVGNQESQYAQQAAVNEINSQNAMLANFQASLGSG